MAALTEHDKALIRGIAQALNQDIRQEIARATAPLQARIDELERKGYCGIWKAGKSYSPQSECPHHGARWLSTKRTEDEPGRSGDWVMIEKSEAAATRPPSATANTRTNGHHAVPRAR
jgi:hypothetical protein